MTDKFAHLKMLVDKVEVDIDKFYNKDNKSAGTRVRKIMQEVKVVAQDIRKDIQEKKKK